MHFISVLLHLLPVCFDLLHPAVLLRVLELVLERLPLQDSRVGVLECHLLPDSPPALVLVLALIRHHHLEQGVSNLLLLPALALFSKQHLRHLQDLAAFNHRHRRAQEARDLHFMDNQQRHNHRRLMQQVPCLA